MDKKSLFVRGFSIILCLSLLSNANYSYAMPASPPAIETTESIDSLLKKSYLELLQLAPTYRFTSKQFEQVRKRLKKEEDTKKSALKRQRQDFERQIRQAQDELKKLAETSGEETTAVAARRHDLHCRIQSLQAQLADIRVASEHGVPIEYENLQAKLDLLEKWPAAKLSIARDVESGQARSRKWGDVQDIGFRTIEPDQEDDIKKGQEAVQEMKQMGLLPKEIEDQELVQYVEKVARNIASNSDLKVPLQVKLLNSKEINAFALPGGFLFVNHGLLQATQNEAQLAGVLAHEISHDVARHGHRLMRKATIASLIYQAAQIGALILTGGVAGIGTYYALQYGFYGLGLALSLQLLGVSRGQPELPATAELLQVPQMLP